MTDINKDNDNLEEHIEDGMLDWNFVPMLQSSVSSCLLEALCFLHISPVGDLHWQGDICMLWLRILSLTGLLVS